MEFEDISYLLDSHKAISLIRADNAPLILGFLSRVFKKENRITIEYEDILMYLTDYLYHANSLADKRYANMPKDYLEQWVNKGFLRSYLSTGDAPVYELTSETEKVLEWVRDLYKREFVGTESRLLIIFDLLRDLVSRSSEDPSIRLELLETQKEQIEKDIEAIKAGNFEKLTATQIKERFQNIDDTIRRLLSDFRQIEENFRQLAHDIRIKRAQADAKKGVVLADIFKEQDLILERDQGRSFQAFWELLMSQDRQDELSSLLDTACSLSEVDIGRGDATLRRLPFILTEEGGKVNRTNNLLVEQLRRFLDDKVYLENKRVMELINSIKAFALELKGLIPRRERFIEIEGDPVVDLFMDRPLFSGAQKFKIATSDFADGVPADKEAACRALLKAISFVDSERLRGNIDKILAQKSQVTLADVVAEFPVEGGTAEVVGYVKLARKDDGNIVSEIKKDVIHISNKESGKTFKITLPQIIFTR